MKVAAVQLDCTCADIEKNTQKIIDYIGEAKALGADMVLFPEIANTGYVLSNIKNLSYSLDDENFKRIALAAKKEQIHVICGVSERDDTLLYNTLAVMDKEGTLVQTYRKTHLFHGEEVYYTPGDTLTTVEIEGVKVGLSICFDLRFPELYRYQALHGVELFVNANAWPHKRGIHWEVLSQARAIENQAYYVGASHVGKVEGVEFHGNSMIISPKGEFLARANATRETLLIADIDIEALRHYRKQFKVLELHRSELY